MTRRRAGESRGRSSSKREPRRLAAVPGALARAARVAAMRVGIVGFVALLGLSAWADLRVRAGFEGKHSTVPAQLFARSLELWPGRALSRGALLDELGAAGYHAAASLSRPGSYRELAAGIEIRTRTFDFPDGREPGRRLLVELQGGRVGALAADGVAVRGARLDPAPIGRIYPTHREDRIPVRLGEVPPSLIAALIAVEDRAFPRHFGLNPKAIGRAALANARAGARVQGGSTITQQLAKNFFLTSERSWRRKLEEVLIALLLEFHYEKDEILQAYLNEVFLGQQGARAIHGVGLAARHYFARHIDELSLDEVALLVGLVKGPSHYNPRRHPERALARRNLVLGQMAAERLVSAEAVAAAMSRPLGVTPAPPPAESPHPAFLDLVRRQLARDYHEEDLRSEGLRIFTTLDPRAQRAAEESLAARIAEFESAGSGRGGKLQGAVVLTDPASGGVRALVGGRRAREPGFNRALDAYRPIGSLVKPAIFLSALSAPREFTLASTVLDAPVRIERPGGVAWAPRNYDGQAHGEVPLYEALARSYNLAAVRLGLRVGVDAVARTLGRLGVQRPLETFPSLLLGAVELSPLDVAAMYQTLAAGGLRRPLRAIDAITDAAGAPVASYDLAATRTIAAEPVYLTVEAMRMVMTRGTGKGAYRWVDRRVTSAGKTGTTDGLRDSWFAGFTGNLLGVVWVGRDDNRPTGLTGSSGALPVWASVVASLPGMPLADHTPAGVRWYWTRATSAIATDPQCPGALPLPFIEGSAPRYAPCAASARAGSAAAG